MGNYEQLEPEFIQRTLALMEQYDRFIDIENIDFSNQYNYTLTINCFLGIIVMPKERVIKQIPDSKLDGRLKEELGIVNTEISSRINNLRQLIHQLRNSVAHFNIEVESSDEQFLFDYLVFKDHDGNIVARFPSGELVPFLRSYSHLLLSQIAT
ncbi:MAG: HEPN family nuclease [Candidatus Thiodiazotropha sp.]